MKKKSGRVQREKKTVGLLIQYYCKHHHTHSLDLCGSCQKLQIYALNKLLKCPFQESKPVCKDCTIHCYSSEMRENIKVVMRYSGPRILFSHPIVAIRHLIDSRK